MHSYTLAEPVRHLGPPPWPCACACACAAAAAAAAAISSRSIDCAVQLGSRALLLGVHHDRVVRDGGLWSWVPTNPVLPGTVEFWRAQGFMPCPSRAGVVSGQHHAGPIAGKLATGWGAPPPTRANGQSRLWVVKVGGSGCHQMCVGAHRGRARVVVANTSVPPSRAAPLCARTTSASFARIGCRDSTAEGGTSMANVSGDAPS